MTERDNYIWSIKINKIQRNLGKLAAKGNQFQGNY